MGLLAVIGHTTRALVDTRPPRAGGVPLYAARALRALGEESVLVTRCAEEDRALLTRLRAYGLPVVWRPGPSAVFRLEYRDGRRFATIEALGAPWRLTDVHGWLRETPRRADWGH